MSRLDERINGLNWDGLRATLDDRGYVVTPQIFGARECRDLVRLFEEHSHFRKVIDMSRYRYGSGTYKYFDTPLPTRFSSFVDHSTNRLRRWPTIGAPG
jgi:hypothetical protein